MFDTWLSRGEVQGQSTPIVNERAERFFPVFEFMFVFFVLFCALFLSS